MDREQSRAEVGRVQSTSKSHAKGLQKGLEEEQENPLQQQQLQKSWRAGEAPGADEFEVS